MRIIAPVQLAKRTLGSVNVYLALQRIIGADRLRYRCLDMLDAQAGERVLDVGCGPAYYRERLADIYYVGYDTDEHYIEWARERFPGQGEFHCAEFGPAAVADVGKVDAVLLMGLLHHIDDDTSHNLLGLLAQTLSPGGRVVTVDTAYSPGQGRIARWMSDNDRGEFVRTPEEFEALTRPYFTTVEGELFEDVARIPGTYFAMRLSNG